MIVNGGPVESALLPRGLFLEADPFLLRLMLRVFSKKFTVAGCSDSREAAEDWHDFDFVIADLTMLTSDMLLRARTLSRSNFRHPIIVLTGTIINQELWDQLAEDGVVYIEKPYTPFELATLVSVLLKRSENHQGIGATSTFEQDHPAAG